jgi:diguanylate cyclase (GGDEF) domain
MDLDQFKIINDTCGHAAGDELLRQLGEVLLRNFRQRDTLARLGGDEFAALIEHCSLKKARKIVSKLQDIIDNFRFIWENKTYRIGVSIGLVPITNQSGSLGELLQQADAACYIAKDEGRNRMRIYHHNDTRLLQRHDEMQFVIQVQEALENDQFCLYKQLIVPVNDETVFDEHYEILIRMENNGELISPGIFLPSVEQYGLSSKLDSWVIDNVFEWLADELPLQKSLSLCSINLSGYSLASEGFLDFIVKKIDNLSDISKCICFEITETAAIANYAKASHFIKTLKQKGCRFALDDFGSGFSSFAHLKNLKVDYLKIDGMFIRDILDDPMALSMVKAINEIGHIVGAKTIAEFVENDQILHKLRDIGIDYAQGYAVGKPHPVINTDTLAAA